MCAVLPPELMQYGSVGLPVPSIEVKLLDHPEAGYLSSNDPPRGEVCIRGPSVTRGYYKRPDLNEDENIFTKDGWLRTGDIGQWNPDGTISLIDRWVEDLKYILPTFTQLTSFLTQYQKPHQAFWRRGT
jgi:long-chain acyl-CoA synthetase